MYSIATYFPLMKHLKSSFLLAAAATSIHAQAQSMTDLGTLSGGGYAQANGVSADGAVVVGYGDGTAGSQRAFRWTSAGGMTDLGVLSGGTFSRAYGVSADGSVVVGYGSNANGNGRAFRWTSAGGMTDLGTLSGGNYSDARGVSADGAVVVGSGDTSAAGRAFRWTSVSGMTDLGVLTGGNSSQAYGVSEDGSVVVGEASNASGAGRAFRWTSAGGMTDLGTLSGGNYSNASGVSANGAVVVGYSASTAGGRAFRWTSAGMADLGTLSGGSYSYASGISADGSVVVGYGDGTAGDRAFRWTSAGGMTDLGTLSGGSYSYANGVSADGAVVVGEADNANGDSRAFIYTNSVMLDVQDWLGSVGGVNSLLSSSLELSRSFMEGAHHRPLAELGRGRSYWVTGDVASSSRTRDLRTRSGEAGATFATAPNVLVGIGAGYGRQDRDLANGGSGVTDGQYLVGEVDLIQDNGGIFSVLVSVGSWNAVTDRGYVTGGGIDYSHGETDLQSTTIRLRYDTPVLTKALGADIKGYISGSTSKAQSDAYSETGGAFAGSFGELKQTAEEGRLGIAATRSFTDKLRGRLSVEWIRRFDSNQAILTATDITSTLDLSLPGAPVVRDQARVGFDLDYLMDAQTTLSFTVHAAGRGESPDVSGAISLRRGF
jgi:probable HAF family extracellular repeat protein